MDPRGLAPKGWHVSSNEEWDKLTDNKGGENEAGIKLKSTGGWNMSGNGTNISGFTVLPGGQRNGNGSCEGIGNTGYWWSSTEKGSDWTYGIWYRSVSNGVGNILWDCESETYGLSVRCIYLQQDLFLGQSDFHT